VSESDKVPGLWKRTTLVDRGVPRGIDRGGRWLLTVLAAVAVAVPLFNQAVPASSAFHLSPFGITLIGKYMCYGMLAMAVDLIWGYCGILSLGHGAFFALGGYAMGMYLMRQIGPRGVYGDPVLPDFMVFLNYKSLPWFWHGFNHFPLALAMVAIVPALLALVFGWFAFRSRVTGVYLSIITQALTYALMLAFFRNDMGFGGNAKALLHRLNLLSRKPNLYLSRPLQQRQNAIANYRPLIYQLDERGSRISQERGLPFLSKSQHHNFAHELMVAQITASIELIGANSLGLMIPTCGTYNAPATPARMPEITNNQSLKDSTG